MKKLNLKKIITMGLIAASLIAVTPMQANAEWKQNSQGWWYTEGSSYATGWRNISGQWYYFLDNGYMRRNNWVYEDNDWTKKYYMNSDGTMRKDPISIDGITYTFDSNGKCIGETSDFKFINSDTLEYRGKLYNYKKDNTKQRDEDLMEAYGVLREDKFIDYRYHVNPVGNTGHGSGSYMYIKDGKILEGDIQLDDGTWYYSNKGSGPIYGWFEVNGRLKYYDWKDGHQIYGNNVTINGKNYSMSRDGLDHIFWQDTGYVQKGYSYDSIAEKSSDWDLLIANGFKERK